MRPLLLLAGSSAPECALTAVITLPSDLLRAQTITCKGAFPLRLSLARGTRADLPACALSTCQPPSPGRPPSRCRSRRSRSLLRRRARSASRSSSEPFLGRSRSPCSSLSVRTHPLPSACLFSAPACATRASLSLHALRGGSLEQQADVLAPRPSLSDAYTLSGNDAEGVFPSILGHEGGGVVRPGELPASELAISRG